MNYRIKRCCLLICLCIPLSTSAKILTNKPNYWPGSKYRLGLGATGLIAWGDLFAAMFEKEEGITISHINYIPHLTTSYMLVAFKKSYLSLEGNVVYMPTITRLRNAIMQLELTEHHLRLCPGLGFTTIRNKYFYELATAYIGYECDVVVYATLKENGLVDTQWPLMKVIGNIVLGARFEFFYGIYINYHLTFPFTEFIHLGMKADEYDRTEPLKNKTNQWRDAFSLVSSLSHTSFLDLGLGVNLLAILYPPHNKAENNIHEQK